MEFRQGLTIGSIVGGDYRIVDVLGQGGFGLTYKGFDTRLGSPVAVKEYFPADMAVREAGQSVHVRSSREEGVFAWGREKFLEEARTLARFRHNNIVRVARLFEENNTAYMVLDFEEGPSLAEWRGGLGRPPRQDELDRIASALLDAVEVVHRGGILHRDIKPQNIIMRHGSEPVLIDFGAARASLGQRSKTVHAIVTPGYSPKEQYALDVDRQGAWTDLYAVGATLYFLVTGRSPPDALTRDLQSPMPMETDGREPYRDSFLEAIDWAMSIRAEDRPQTVAEWRGALFAEQPTVATSRRAPFRGIGVPTEIAPDAGVRRSIPARPPQGARPATLVPQGVERTPVPSEQRSVSPRNITFDDLGPPAPVAPPKRSAAGALVAGLLIAFAAAGGLAYYTLVIQPEQDEAAWESARSVNTIAAYQAYLTRRPNGRYAADARQRLDEFAQPRPRQAGPSNGLTPQPSPREVPPTTPPPGNNPADVPATPAPVPPVTPPAAPPLGPTPRAALPPRTLPAALSPAEVERLRTAVAPASWRFVSGLTGRIPGVTQQSTDFIAEVARLSGNRITLTVTDPQQIGGVGRLLTSVRDQRDLTGWHMPISSVNRRRAFLIAHGAVPFGLGPADHVRWLRDDGARLLEQLYARDNYHVRVIPCGIAGSTGAWFRREIRSPTDFRGLKVRSIGLAGSVLQRLGAEGTGSQVNDLAAAFAANTVDAALFSTSLTAIFVRSPPPAAVYHFPSWHVSASLFELLIGEPLWLAMSEDQRKVIDEACRTNLDKWAVQYESSQTEVLTQIRNQRTLVRPFTRPTLEALRKATDEVLAEEASRDPEFKEFLDSYNRFRRR